MVMIVTNLQHLAFRWNFFSIDIRAQDFQKEGAVVKEYNRTNQQIRNKKEQTTPRNQKMQHQYSICPIP